VTHPSQRDRSDVPQTLVWWAEDTEQIFAGQGLYHPLALALALALLPFPEVPGHEALVRETRVHLGQVHGVQVRKVQALVAQAPTVLIVVPLYVQSLEAAHNCLVHMAAVDQVDGGIHGLEVLVEGTRQRDKGFAVTVREEVAVNFLSRSLDRRPGNSVTEAKVI
jgi:hypothetical protein